MRITLAAISLALLATPLAASLAAAPLCRDSKGLFTPCIGVRMPPARTPRPRTAQGTVDDRASADRAGASQTAGIAGRHGPALRTRVGRGKLCRDSKGLFKPC